MSALLCDSTEPLIPLRDIPKLNWIPKRRGGSRLNVATIWRWVHRGCAGVKLPTADVGSCPCVTESSLRQFFIDVAEAKRGGDVDRPVVRSPARRERDVAAAKKRLQEAGI
jgi:hypothetical protein